MDKHGHVPTTCLAAKNIINRFILGLHIAFFLNPHMEGRRAPRLFDQSGMMGGGSKACWAFHPSFSLLGLTGVAVPCVKGCADQSCQPRRVGRYGWPQRCADHGSKQATSPRRVRIDLPLSDSCFAGRWRNRSDGSVGKLWSCMRCVQGMNVIGRVSDTSLASCFLNHVFLKYRRTNRWPGWLMGRKVTPG